MSDGIGDRFRAVMRAKPGDNLVMAGVRAKRLGPKTPEQEKAAEESQKRLRTKAELIGTRG